MNGRDLLSAIAGADEAYLRESEQFSAVAAKIRADRKKERRRVIAVGIAVAVCVVMLGIMKNALPSFRLFAPSGVTDADPPGQDRPSGAGGVTADTGPRTTADGASTTAEPGSAVAEETASAVSAIGDQTPSVPVSETTRREPETEPQVTELPSATSVPEKPTVPEEKDPSEPSAEPPTEPSTDQSEPGSPGAVFTSVKVSYSEAKEIFGHPIVPCSSSSFIGYQVGVVSRNGDIHASGAFCLSVTYRFSNGSIDLQDQDRSAGSAAHNTGDRYEYGGRTFYVWPEGYADDGLYVGYFPTGDSGIAYQAFFEEDADVYEIMDLILSVEI